MLRSHRHGARAKAPAPYRLYRRVENPDAKHNEVSLFPDETGFAPARAVD
jgi:hypothetical protein